jgi:DNA-binding response OmpR family regulator
MGKWVRILVVEDDEIIRKALQYYLKLYGFKVAAAPDGPTAIKMAQDQKPELILLDWMMPGMDGMEVLSELKHDDRTSSIPVFMLTGRGMIGDLDQAFTVGADDYITKPMDISQLGQVVRDKWEKYKEKVHQR